ncbi:MAG: response regulator [Chloroflexi bacterium]|nr:response regulator [Chloroflexota bacterium]
MNCLALIVDDNPTNLDVLAALLRREGVTPLLAESPRDLPAALEEVERVDVVFLDLEFPNYDGLELIIDLKQDARLRDAPFVAYTVHVSEQNEARNAGFDSFIGKPLNVERFPDQLSRILNGEMVWEAG